MKKKARYRITQQLKNNMSFIYHLKRVKIALLISFALNIVTSCQSSRNRNESVDKRVSVSKETTRVYHEQAVATAVMEDSSGQSINLEMTITSKRCVKSQDDDLVLQKMKRHIISDLFKYLDKEKIQVKSFSETIDKKGAK